MYTNPYAAFLPNGRRAAAESPAESRTWLWEGHQVHVLQAQAVAAGVRIIVVHGAGAHSDALWPMAAQLVEQGLDVAAIDLPLYGRTRSPLPQKVRYDDWVRLLRDFVAVHDDGRPIILLGASIGGLLAYEVAAGSRHVAAVVATCLLDPGDWRARARMTRFGPIGILAGLLSILSIGPLSTKMIPLRWVANLARMSRNPELSKLCATDPLGGGGVVPVGFLASWIRYRHTPPASTATPVLLVHPEFDSWTPMRLSSRVLDRIAAPTRTVVLRQCGHFPVEEPGLTDLVDAVIRLSVEVVDYPDDVFSTRQ